MSLLVCLFRASDFLRTGQSPRNLPSHPHEHDTCAVTPCTAIQGQNKCRFSEEPLGTSLWAIWAAANGGVTNGGLRGVWPPFPEISRNRPCSPFFYLFFCTFPEGLKSTWKIQKTEEKGLSPQISSDFLRPPSLKPPFAAPHPKDPSVLKVVRQTNPLYFATAVVFQYPYRFPASVSQKNKASPSPPRSVLLRLYRIFFPYRISLSVVFLVREGPLAKQWSSLSFVQRGPAER